ncbi:Glucooligosaccharide oxidase [Xylaria sp. FL0043]|nr:Glucooligosaccharide oxidase [Xylaria sp. FL0043]
MLHVYFSLVAWITLVINAAVSETLAASSRNIATILTNTGVQWAPHTSITFPGDAGFENATMRWTVFRPPTYRAAISPSTEKDVVNAVRLARDNGIAFLGTGGRHGYGTTLGTLQNGLALDLSKLNGVSVDKKAGTLTVGPGVHFEDIFDPVFNAGYAIPTGSCSCVGMIGATIGAGIGRFSGLYGLLLDQLVSARVVTADGRLVTVSARSNVDLFWGIRGAGANLGIVTSATFKLSPLVNGGMFANYDMIFPAEKNQSYFKAIAALGEGRSALPAKLAMATAVTYDNATGRPQILSNWVYAGSQAEAKQAIKPILDLQPSFLNASVLPWNKLTAEAGFGLDASLCLNNKIYDIYGVNLKRFDVPTFMSVFAKMGDFYRAYPAGRSTSLTLEAFPNQATLATADAATAYPWRDTKYNILLQFTWDQAHSAVQTPSTQLALELRQDFAATSGYGNLTVYVNYAHGDETSEQIYRADKLPRLTQLKRKWDPDNVFRFSNALPM